MTHKGIKAALILGPVTVAIMAFCAFQQGFFSGFQGQRAIPAAKDVPLTEARLTSMLSEMSGNKGYDSWSAEKKEAFKNEQLQMLESLTAK